MWRTADVAWSVGLSVKIVSPAKAAEPIEMLFGVWTRVGPGNHVLNVGAHCRHLANMIEPSMYSGDAAFWQSTLVLSKYFDNY